MDRAGQHHSHSHPEEWPRGCILSGSLGVVWGVSVGRSPHLVPVVLHHPAGLLQHGPREQQVSGVSHHEEVLGPALEGALVPAGLTDVDGGRQGWWHLLGWEGQRLCGTWCPCVSPQCIPTGAPPARGDTGQGMEIPFAAELSGNRPQHPEQLVGAVTPSCTTLTPQPASGEPHQLRAHHPARDSPAPPGPPG